MASCSSKMMASCSSKLHGDVMRIAPAFALAAFGAVGKATEAPIGRKCAASRVWHLAGIGANLGTT